MTQTKSPTPDTTSIDDLLGLVFEDQRTNDLKKVIYADDAVVLTRDESGHTTLTQRSIFRSQLNTRYQPRPDAETFIEGGKLDGLTERIEDYERQEGRKSSHKAEALAEAVALLTGADDGEDDDLAEEVPFEEIAGIGPATAERLRSKGFETRRDVLAADDEDLLAVSGVGESTLANIREFVD